MLMGIVELIGFLVGKGRGTVMGRVVADIQQCRPREARSDLSPVNV